MINIKLRLQNKTTLVTLIIAVLALVYQLLAIFNVVPKVSEDTMKELLMMVVNILSILGIVIDPTTKGISDSEQAMTYTEPKE